MKETFKRSFNDIFSGLDKKSLKISLLGVGSELRADDSAGLVVAQNLIDKCRSDKCGLNDRLQVIYGETAPENFTSDIKRFSPTHLIVVDAAEMGLESGSLKIIKKEEIKGVTFSTHVLPLSVMIDYLSNSFNFETIVIGVEPKDMEFGNEVSKEVKKTVDMVSEVIFNFVKGLV
ncbi:MAG: hydrogenase maturation peptidase HycI [bacterium]